MYNQALEHKMIGSIIKPWQIGKAVETIQWFAEKCVGIERGEEKEEEGEEEPYVTDGYPVIYSVCM